jgi:hypothetical protein
MSPLHVGHEQRLPTADPRHGRKARSLDMRAGSAALARPSERVFRYTAVSPPARKEGVLDRRSHNHLTRAPAMQTSFEIDKNTERALQELKEFFGVKTNSAVIKRALALAQIAAESTDEKKQLTIVDKHEHKEKVVLMGAGL